MKMKKVAFSMFSTLDNKYRMDSGTILKNTVSSINGMQEKIRSHRHEFGPMLGSTIHAKAASPTVPTVQKSSINIKNMALLLDGRYLYNIK
jgi:hypothetical protein